MSDSQPKPITTGKKYQTRDGREVRIYCMDGGGNWPVHGAVKTAAGWDSMTWLSDGKADWTFECLSDLVEVRARIKRTAWINIYENNTLCIHSSLEFAKAQPEVFARVRVDIDCAEGEGL